MQRLTGLDVSLIERYRYCVGVQDIRRGKILVKA